MARVSYSQYSMYSSCPQKYKLSYIDKQRSPAGIHAQFGTAMHETIQHYLDVFYKATKKLANEINLEVLLKQQLIEAVTKDSEKLPEGEFVCTREEIEEFYWQGVEILRYFKKDKNRSKFFQKKGYELVGIEVPINFKVKENINAIGFIDVIIREIATGKITIIDLKTSTKGWSKWQKGDETKKNQIILYKKWYSEQYNVPIDTISVEFHIMKRILPPDDEVDWVIPRISKFVPPSGKIKQRQANEDFMWFVGEVFNEDGSYKEKEYVKKAGNHCKWCDFNGTLCNPKE